MCPCKQGDSESWQQLFDTSNSGVWSVTRSERLHYNVLTHMAHMDKSCPIKSIELVSVQL